MLALIACVVIALTALGRSSAKPTANETALPLARAGTPTVGTASPDVSGSSSEVTVVASDTPVPTLQDQAATATDTPTATAIVTTTPTPTASDTPTTTPTATDTTTPTPMATDTPTVVPTPQCSVAMGGPFLNVWQTYRERLGCPRQSSPLQVYTAEQPFENGHMFWRQDWDDLFVVYDGRGDIYNGGLLWRDEPWTEGMPTDSCNDAPPPGLLRPIRGFGLLWCNELGASEARIGWALLNEQGFTSQWQDFEHGSMFVDSDGNNRGLVYVFFYREALFVRVQY